MPTHKECKTLTYSTEHLFNIVLDVAKYPEFLPWLSNACVYGQKEGEFLAALTIGYKIISETYTSKVCYVKDQYVNAECIKGPFKWLKTQWHFKTMPENMCVVEFSIDYEFSNFIFEKLLSSFFHEASTKILSAFEERAFTTSKSF